MDRYEAFARYVALGNRLEISDRAGVLGGILEKYSGRSFERLIPHSREHAKNAAAVDGAFVKLLILIAGWGSSSMSSASAA
jgi:hypothetical protein